MIGAARAVSDVLMYQPDFVGIDFEEAKEGIKEDTKTDFPVPLTGNAYEHAQRQRRKHHSI